MKDFAGNEIDESAMTLAIASIDWSQTEGSGIAIHAAAVSGEAEKK